MISALTKLFSIGKKDSLLKLHESRTVQVPGNLATMQNILGNYGFRESLHVRDVLPPSGPVFYVLKGNFEVSEQNISNFRTAIREIKRQTGISLLFDENVYGNKISITFG